MVSPFSSRTVAMRLLACTLLAGIQAAHAAAPADEPPAAPAATSPERPAERPLDRLSQSLALTPQQLPLWQAYVARLDAYAQLHYREKPAQATDSAPQQFARLVDLQQNRLAALEDIEDAAQALYRSLTSEQRKLADQRLYATLPVFASAGSPPGPTDADTRRPQGMQHGGGRRERPPGGF